MIFYALPYGSSDCYKTLPTHCLHQREGNKHSKKAVVNKKN